MPACSSNHATKNRTGKKLAYWALVESYRTAKGPRQRIVAYLGQLKESRRQGIKRIAEGKDRQIVERKDIPEGQGSSDNKSKPQFVQARLFNNDPLNNDSLNNIPLNNNPLHSDQHEGMSWYHLIDNVLKVKQRKLTNL